MIATSIPARRLALAVVAALLGLALVLPGGAADAQVPNPTATPTPDTATSKRLSGESRFDTAAAIAADAFPDGADNVVIARGDTFPDALAGSFLAGVQAAPILLTNTDDLPPGTEQGLQKIKRKAFVLGGPGAISETVVAQLKADGLEVERIAGDSRYDTARRIATSPAIEAGDMRDTSNPPGPNNSGLPANTAFLVTGDSFADALAAGPLAFWGKHPVILTRPDTLSDEAKAVIQDETLKIAQVVIVGGRGAVSVTVEDQVKALDKTVVRVSGATRNETAIELAKFYVANQMPASGQTRIGYAEINLALGQRFPDALALGPRGGKTNSVILLSQTPEELGDATRAFIGEQCDPADTIVVAGGEAAITQESREAATQAAICGTANNFTMTPTQYTRLYGEDHVVTVNVSDASGNGVAGVFVKLDIYRADRTAPDPRLQPLAPPNESKTGKTDAEGNVALTYTYDPQPSPTGTQPGFESHDTLVACAHPTEQFPSTCLAEEQRNANLLMAEGTTDWFRDGVRTTLTGEAETPTPGDEVAEGVAVVAFTERTAEGADAPTKVLCFMIDITGLEDPATAAHIHKAPVGEAGPIAVTLKPPPDADGFTQQCAGRGDFASGMTVSSRIDDIKANPADYYVNVHNTEFPDGALRGQLGS